jgi:hypothetical protein
MKLGYLLYKISTFQQRECIGYYELNHHKPRFDEGCSELLAQKAPAKLQWL